jgi:hypothetical protein
MTQDLLFKLKENNEDFEWYPTTKRMIETIFYDYIKDKKDYTGMVENFSMLDIGAGNGNVFQLFEDLFPKPKDEYTSKTHIDKFAIEKSKILIDSMPSDIIIIGTDFLKQTLIDKKVDVIFCNPPYKEFKEWTLKILKEANCKVIYLIIPERWKEDQEILNILNKRLNKYVDDVGKIKDNKYQIIYSDDFLNSEYRESRAKIDIVKIDFKKEKTDPFDIWFEENFKINADKKKDWNYKTEQEKKENIKQLIQGNIIEALEELYQKDLEKLLNTYKQLENIGAELFKEMGVNLGNLKSGLKEKIKGLKNLYWKELFDNLNKITEKLTSKSRKIILDKLHSQTNIDFTRQNAYALIIWVLKNANIYIDEQLKDVYFEMADKENIRLYKSNKKLVEDGWRFQKFKQTHFKLDYRLVFRRYSCFDESGYRSYDYSNGLYKDVHTFINDISTVANNLGFENIESSFNFEWQPGEENIFYYDKLLDKEFMRVRAYKNGNIHCKINQEFMKKFNIEMARLNKWVKDIKECSEELDIDIKDVENYFNCNKKLLKNELKLLDYEG